MSIVSRLKAARERLAQGWCQHSYMLNILGKDGIRRRHYCAAGSLCIDEEPARPVIEFLAKRLPGYSPEYPLSTLTQWNDHPHRTQTEVLALFDQAIADAEQQESA